MATSYAIKDGYEHREEPAYFVDDSGAGITFQVDVYWYAFGVGVELAATGLIDIGCGRADKLAQIQAHRPDWRYDGIDFGPNIDWCRTHLSWGTWLEMDLEQQQHIDARDSVIVCADAIEHLRDPSYLLKTIKASNCAAAVLSTPERDLTSGTEHMGPPPNPCHVREWNLEEFGDLLNGAGLNVEHLGLTRSNDQGPGAHTILARVS